MDADFEFSLELTQARSIKGAMEKAEAGRGNLWFVPPENLRVIEGFNVRIKDEAYQARVRAYADSMKAEGFYPYKPLAGYAAQEGNESLIYIYDGHTRLDSVMLARGEGALIEKVPVVVSPAVDMVDLNVALVRANDGERLAPMEAAIVCKRLARFNLSVQEIALRVGFTVQYVTGLLSLASAPSEIRQMVIEGRVAAAVAIETLVAHGDKTLEVLRSAEEKALAAGKTRVTQRFVDTSSRPPRYVVKAAVPLFSALSRVKVDPGYETLSEETRKDLEEIFAALEAAKAKERAKAEKAAVKGGEQVGEAE